MTPAILLDHLSFRYELGQPEVLRDISLECAPGTRWIVVGANGAGKTTLLRVVGGRHMVPDHAVQVLGRPAFHDTSLAHEVVTLGGPFPFDVDLPVRHLVSRVRNLDPALRDRLVEVLGIDLDWSMFRVSDGQRRRVQVLMGLLRRPRVLLLDEVTHDLDVIARQDLMAYLREISEEQGTTILYATHIFDTMDTWATHVAWLSRGLLARAAAIDELPELVQARARGASTPLLAVVEAWLRAERDSETGAVG